MLKITCFFLFFLSWTPFYGYFGSFFEGGFDGHVLEEKKPAPSCTKEELEEVVEPYVEPIPPDPFPFLHEMDGAHATLMKDAILESLFDGVTMEFIKSQGITRPKRRLRVLDLGCGNGNISISLANYLGKKASIKGIDHDGAKVSEARRRARGGNAFNARFDKGTLENLSEIRSSFFDLIICRLFFLDSNRLEDTLNTVTRLLKQGGKVIFIETVSSDSLSCVPSFSAFEEIKSLITNKLEKRGVQVDMGQKLISALYHAGCKIDDVRFFHPVLKTPQEKRFYEMEVHQMKDTLLSEGKYSEEELDDFIRQIKEKEHDNYTTFSCYEVAMISATKR